MEVGRLQLQRAASNTKMRRPPKQLGARLVGTFFIVAVFAIAFVASANAAKKHPIGFWDDGGKWLVRPTTFWEQNWGKHQEFWFGHVRWRRWTATGAIATARACSVDLCGNGTLRLVGTDRPACGEGWGWRAYKTLIFTSRSLRFRLLLPQFC